MRQLTVDRLELCLALALAATAPVFAQHGAESGEWRHYAGDSGSSKYSPLAQIDGANFAQLEEVWRWRSADERLTDTPYEPGMFRATPLMVSGKIYVPTGMSQVAALDAGTGRELWVHDPQDYERGRPVHGLVQIRGIEYWTDGSEERIFLATSNRQLVSMDLATGQPDRRFGEDGVVDLSQNLGREGLDVGNIGHSAPVIVVGDVIVVGSLVFDFPTAKGRNPPGHVRAYDVRTGEFLWRFHSVPQEGEPYTETWENESWKTMGNTNVWSMMSADQELGYVYLPFGTPSSDYYGGDRHGDNVYAESLVCLDVETGKRVWHFQTVHHGIWDYDLASAPNLVDIVVRGRKIKAVAQASKQGFLYVFDRVTGEPVWPIEERPVNFETSVPGEKLARTQPFPTKPPAFERQGATVDDLADFTPEIRARALELAEDFVLGPIFTPTIVQGEGGKQATIVMPGAGGGASWPGASVDPETGMLYVQSMTRPSALGLAKPDRAQWRYMVAYSEIPTIDGLPLFKPPYRRITAVNLHRGDHSWMIPFGEGPTRHPLLEDLDTGPLGSQFPAGVISEGGLLITRTLLVTFQAKLDELGDRRAHGAFLQAYDKATGELLAQVETDRSLHGSPMTYMHEGRQYVVVAGGGGRGGEPAELIAWALPEAVARAAAP